MNGATRSLFIWAPLRALLMALAMHSVYYGAEMLHSQYCTRNFFLSLFSSGSSSCMMLRHVSDISRNALPTILVSIAYTIGSVIPHATAPDKMVKPQS